MANLRRFAMHGGPDLSDIRGHELYITPPGLERGPIAGSLENPSQSGWSLTPTAKTSPYNDEFVQAFIKLGIYPYIGFRYDDGSRPAPAHNHAYLKRRLLRDRPHSPQWTSTHEGRCDAQDDFCQLMQRTAENSIKTAAVAPLEGTGAAKADSGEWHSAMPFDNCATFGEGLPIPLAVPDLYWGAAPAKIPRSVLDHLSRFIVPGTEEHRPVAPNFFIEMGNFAERRAVNAGAIGVRAIHALESYGRPNDEPAALGDIKAICVTYSGTLTIYGYHQNPRKPGTPETGPSTASCILGTWAMNNPEPPYGHDAIMAVRNAMEYAREIRDVAIQGAIARHREAA
ncbi:hypothetical protein BDV95DRAFT_590240 [Massariosphaeria phaeospora]|uniref:Uncharacterized protein n=1 Tax=Massariosphaeria phaeospora TaxID=100035 RepID=A0A7C8IIZ2_9PLEO|nr:hypothetical protein BDV95DRAFT_590240 [Massariosphaeria phaeospora]